MTTTNIAIIGAGQLGSRHLQGLKKAQVPMNIYVLDTNEASLTLCEQRYNEIAENKLVEKILFTTQWDTLPDKIDVAIVATSSKPRCAIIHNLVENNHCHRLVLEKFLFPKMSQYDEIAELFHQNNVRAWVNCARRYFSCYQQLKKLLINDGPVQFVFEGKNWGLCCNSIHFIDLFTYLSGAQHIQFDCSGIDLQLYESKRSGYIELTGTIKGLADNHSTFQISAYADSEGIGKLFITSQNHTIEIFESQKRMLVDGIEQNIIIPYQSELTGKFIEMLLKDDKLVIPSFEESSILHQLILPYFLDIYNRITGTQKDLCPIT